MNKSRVAFRRMELEDRAYLVRVMQSGLPRDMPEWERRLVHLGLAVWLEKVMPRVRIMCVPDMPGCILGCELKSESGEKRWIYIRHGGEGLLDEFGEGCETVSLVRIM